ncbi:glycosyl hydrolase family 18 protein [Stigmatella sp. ncwal1]|uniref:chitinase n=1 Tax=Stigmatella ashevillensis TaxID=2995309 RepID=A0ABT5D8W0_9BACT|nr:glycosyl hydrolase family 18 protein [Stigmatella ashevillena]MDC0709558.1 glycosyl hydrolase family 18 protein [Stigmatella ashevillena]
MHAQELTGGVFTFQTTSVWSTGYCAQLRFTNTTGAALSQWTVTFQLPSGMGITSLYNGQWSAQGQVQTVKDQGWNGPVPVGGTASFSFCGHHAGTAGTPFNYTLNGTPGSGSPPPPQPPSDIQPPSVVQGLSVVSKTAQSVELTWQAASDNVGVTGYEVFQNGASTAAATPSGTQVSVGGLQPGTAYVFTVKARDAVGNRSTASAPLTVSTDPLATPKHMVGYFVSWGLYQRQFYAKNLDTSGTAAKLTHLNYAFGRVANGRCDISAGNPEADYTWTHTAAMSVDGVADSGQPLRGNFNQLKKLKAKYPHLKVLISLGGADWSTGFSDAVSTAAKRQIFVQSCIDLYIRGNLPVGAGLAAGLFDGIDVDWEFPAVNWGGQQGRPEDTVNFTEMLAEFRRQLDAVRPGLLLTIASGSSEDVFSKIQLNVIPTYLDFITVMTYDMHGGWDPTTNFHAALYNQTANPAKSRRDSTHEALQGHLAAGVPPGKLVLGIPLYGRGWQSTQAGPLGDGLYQSTSGPARGNWDVAGNSGMFDYYHIKNVLEPLGVKRRHPEAQVPYLYNSATGLWVSYDDPVSVGVKGQYIRDQQLGGAMFWDLSSDDAQGSLVAAMKTALNP